MSMVLLARFEHFKVYVYTIDKKKKRFMIFMGFKIKMILRSQDKEEKKDLNNFLITLIFIVNNFGICAC